MNDDAKNRPDKEIRRAVVLLLIVAACFYLGFIIATGMQG
jgi:amino acid transporter